MTLVVDKVLCPVDFSDPSREAMEIAVELARKLDASLTLLHVVYLPAVGFPEGAFAYPTGDITQKAEDALLEWKKECEQMGIHVVHTQTIVGAPFQEIINVARTDKYDLIVLGTHGRTGLDHLLVGSVAEKVVRRAPCPVLTVRPRAAREA